MRVPEEAEARDVGDSRGLEAPQRLCGPVVQLAHAARGLARLLLPEQALGRGREHEAGTERLRQEDGVTRPRRALSPERIGVNGPDHREPVLRLLIADGVAAGQDGARFVNLRGGGVEDGPHDLDREVLGERGDGKSDERTSPHGEDVVQGVRGGDRAEEGRVVDHGRKEVGGEDERPVVVEPVDGRVVRRSEADEQVLGRAREET
jgi:hypothetical protein